ncbi:hypothetical protein CYMTET_21329 [Cymbomonas tetramitiformis]|uniref:Fungal lipase-type domain-containing protein n=1 Tax=Cymbomonas tetramitiformis TaxID=36881 RepID=A0AAE0G2C4_9CHLO|nr:hypothetical protein CYMTET_21329 [Cymbomonas tetramitiformis]
MPEAGGHAFSAECTVRGARQWRSESRRMVRSAAPKGGVGRWWRPGACAAALEFVSGEEVGTTPVMLCTFGSPRVGNEAFSQTFPTVIPNAVRVVAAKPQASEASVEGLCGDLVTWNAVQVNKGDVVPTVPRGGFKHVGVPLILQEDGGYQILQKGGWASVMNRYRPGKFFQVHRLSAYARALARCEEWLQHACSAIVDDDPESGGVCKETMVHILREARNESRKLDQKVISIAESIDRHCGVPRKKPLRAQAYDLYRATF